MEEEDFFITVSQVQLKTHLAKCILGSPGHNIDSKWSKVLKKFMFSDKIHTSLKDWYSTELQTPARGHT